MQTASRATQQLTADDFDKCDSSAQASQTEIQQQSLKQDAKKESSLLDQGKILADSFDSSSSAKAVVAPKAAPAPVLAAPVQQQNVQVDSQMEEGLAADNSITTDELEKQANDLVKQASAVLGTPGGAEQPAGEQLAQQPADQPPQDAQTQIASLVDKLKTLTAEVKGPQ